MCTICSGDFIESWWKSINAKKDKAKIGVKKISNKCNSYSLISFGNIKTHRAGATLH